MSVTLRNATQADFPALLALNEADVTHLSPLTAAGLEQLVTMAALRRVAVTSDGIAGFLLALAEDAPSNSVNFRYFKQRYEGFLYVNRIVVAAPARRLGVASRLYEDLESEAKRRGITLLTCEIHVDPPNPGSLAFHAQRGFVEVGTQQTAAGFVSLRVKRLGQ